MSTKEQDDAGAQTVSYTTKALREEIALLKDKLAMCGGVFEGLREVMASTVDHDGYALRKHDEALVKRVMNKLREEASNETAYAPDATVIEAVLGPHPDDKEEGIPE